MATLLFLTPIVFKLVVLVWIVWMTRDLARFAQAIVGGGMQFVALLVLIIGCVMVVVSKKYGIDTTISGGVIGCGVNMLTGHAVQKPGTPADPSQPAAPAQSNASSPDAS